MTLQRIEGSALKFLTAGETEKPRALVVMLHGYGTDCYDLHQNAHHFASKLQGAMLVFPNAPLSLRDTLPADQIAAMETERPDADWEKFRTWMASKPTSQSSSSRDPAAAREAFIAEMSATASVPVRALGRLIDALLAQYSLTDEALIIYGFSQGGMVATYLGITRPHVCAGVVNHSGQFWGALHVASKPRTLIVVGEHELAPNQGMSKVYQITKSELQKAGVEVHTRECKGLGHGINKDAIGLICSYIETSLKLPPS